MVNKNVLKVKLYIIILMIIWKEVLVRNGCFLCVEIVIFRCGIKVNYFIYVLIRKYEKFNNLLLFFIFNYFVYFVYVFKKIYVNFIFSIIDL